MKSKVIIVINGKGGAGKDTLCEHICRSRNARNISSIDPIKDIATKHGWNGKKDDRGRRFLSELKTAFTNYNNYPTVYLIVETTKFLLEDTYDILFVHIREPEQIDSYKEEVRRRCSMYGVDYVVCTLLVKSQLINDAHLYGNPSDDNVYDYQYDYTFVNEAPIERSVDRFRSLIDIITNSANT